MLGKSTPEGARDYLVPSRVHPGSFYALPQSPQIYKQILMVAGYDRYMQIARCFRDEDLRADRQPEFTQIDVEMAFVEREDILNVIDGLVGFVAEKITGQKVSLAAAAIQLSRRDGALRQRQARPAVRHGAGRHQRPGREAAASTRSRRPSKSRQARVRGLNVKGGAEKYSRKTIDELTQFVGQYGAKGLAFFRVKEGALDSPIAKFFSEAEQREMIERFDGEPGDLLFLVADAEQVGHVGRTGRAAQPAGQGTEALRSEGIARRPGSSTFRWSPTTRKKNAGTPSIIRSATRSKRTFPYLDSDPGRVRAQSYDLVVNGYEAASGSVRIHDAATQQKVFSLLGIAPEEAERRFGFLLEALRYGAPPHAGIALGLDRWVMLFCGNENIREVIAFPKTQKAADLLSGAPSPVDDKQLRDLRIRVDLPA